LWEQAETLRPSGIKITQSQPRFLYQFLSQAYDHLGLNCLGDELIKDLIIARIYQPVSKRETVEILSDAFGKHYSLKTVYRHLKTAVDQGLKDKFQTALINFAKEELHDSLRLVFYDVTTLAFDSQSQKGLKDFGFSKDHRFQDVQIMIGLVVNRDGFPLYFDIFHGKTFEGHTFVHVVENILKLLGHPELIVIADAAMLSKTNLEALVEKQIGFVVGARLANLSLTLQEEIHQKLAGQNQKVVSLTYLNYRLICQYSRSRAAKDRHERDKQIHKAQQALSSPGQISNRLRFLRVTNKKYELNQSLVEKARKLEGIKGYLTNTSLDENTIIDRYHDLWRIEKSFRVTKSDLEARPIFLQLDKTITCHLIIVFAGLAISRYLEINTEMSVHQIVKLAQKILTHKIVIKKTGETGLVETTVEDPVLCGKLDKLRALGH
jgi:transposase